MADDAMITKEKQKEIDRQALRMPGSYEARLALTPTMADIAEGRNTAKQMEAYIMGDQLPGVPDTSSIVASAPTPARGNVTPNEVVPAPGGKKKKKEKQQGMGAGVTGEVPTSVLGSVNITSPQLLGT